MILTSPPPASWTRPVVALSVSCLVVTGALWGASAPMAPAPVAVPADGEKEQGADEERDFAAAADANVFGVDREACPNGVDVMARADVNAQLNAMNEFAASCRIVPAFVNGKAIGFKAFSIQPGSFLARHGFHNGDVVSRINGYDLSSPDKALETYSKIKEANAFVVEGARTGVARTWCFTIEENANAQEPK